MDDQQDATPAAGVRGEHELRTSLKLMNARYDRLLRAVEVAHRYAYGRQDRDDLRDLRRALASVGFPAPQKPVPPGPPDQLAE